MTVLTLTCPVEICVRVRRSGASLSARTTLTYTDAVLAGEALRTDDNRVAAVAQATLAALAGLVAGGEVESAQIVAVPGRKVALTVVEFPGGEGGFRLYVGSALVRGEIEDAVARSVLDAVTARTDEEQT